MIREDKVAEFLPGEEAGHPGVTVTAHYFACFAGVPDDTVRKIAHARNRVPATLRALLLAALAEPEEDTPKAMLRDWLEEHGPGWGDGPTGTPAEERATCSRLADAEESRHRRRLAEIRRRLRAAQKACHHPRTTYYPDPSGNNDSWTECNDCGAEVRR